MITVYTLTYNEEVILPHFIQHYRSRFPNCRIVIFDNESTDNTQTIAKAYNCELRINETDNEIDDEKYLSIKNSCWKDADTDWVVVVDCDEFLDITPELLDNADFNIIKATGYDMYGTDGNINHIFEGIKSDGYSKICCFKKREFAHINYAAGCHSALPINIAKEVKYNKQPVNLYHFKWISWEYGVQRMKMFGTRLSDINKQYGWGIHYTFPEHTHRDYYDMMNREKTIVRHVRS